MLLGTHGSNHILLIVFGGEGWFFVNDSMVGKLKLDPNSVSGDVSAISGYFTSNTKEGSITRFEDFTVWAPCSGPGKFTIQASAGITNRPLKVRTIFAIKRTKNLL